VAGSQKAGESPAAPPVPGASFSYGGSVISSGDGAPWSGSTAAFPARSAQGKEPWWLAEVKERVDGVKGGRGEREEGGHLLGASQRVSALSLALCSEKERKAAPQRSGVGGWRGEGSGVR
jgi:hypothetical protein